MEKAAWLGRSVFDLDTPCLLVDLDVLTPNIERIAQATDAAGLDLRPHIKAHKTPQVALMQVRAGAVGVTAAKVSEAEVFAAAGIDDIFVANQIIGEPKLQRMTSLSRYVPRLAVAVDSLPGAQQLSKAFAAAGRTIDVILEVDSGAGRCGVPPEQLLELGDQVDDLSGLRIAGIFAYAGLAYQLRGREAFGAYAAEEAAFLNEQAESLRRGGFAIRVVSGGCTPTAGLYKANCGLSELRPGTYCLNDRNQIDLGACTEAQVAATVLATMISVSDRTICDAGTKALGTQVGNISDGFGWVWGDPEGVLYKLNDEHGYLDTGPMHEKPRIGDKLRIIPPRICTCLNLYNEMYVIYEGHVVDVWPIAARGAIR